MSKHGPFGARMDPVFGGNAPTGTGGKVVAASGLEPIGELFCISFDCRFLVMLADFPPHCLVLPNRDRMNHCGKT